MDLSMSNPVITLQGVFINSLNLTAKKYYVEEVDYLKVWELEKSVDLDSWLNWFHNNAAISIYISIFYLAAVFFGQHVMKNRKPFVLKEALVIWNFLLAAYSIVGFMRTIPELIHIFKQENSIYVSVCSLEHHNRATAFWALLFALSKVAELGDTAFSVLRKKPVTPLAWIHHSATLVICFLFYSQQSTLARWFMIMNYFVHSFMYPYFAFKTLNIHFPKFVPMTITFFQLAQMFLGFGIATYALYAKTNNLPCSVPVFQVYTFPLLYAGFVYLFGNLFYNSYIKKKPARSLKKE